MVQVSATTDGESAKSIPARFREADAVEPGRAMAWVPDDKTEQMMFRRLVEKGALVEMRPGTWYLDEEKLAAPEGGQGIVVLLLTGVATLAGAMMLLLRTN